MKFLYQIFTAKRGQKVKVNFSQPTSVKLFKDKQFDKYKKCRTNTYRGGKYEDSPAVFEIPSDGKWIVVIEKGTHYNPIDIEGSVELLPVGSDLPVTRALDAPVPTTPPQAQISAEEDNEVATDENDNEADAVAVEDSDDLEEDTEETKDI